MEGFLNSEEKGKQAVARNIFVGITGGSGSGKSTVANLIAAKLSPNDVVIIEQDWYYKDRSSIPLEKRESINYDHPSAFETELLIGHVKKLKNNLSIKRPVYDFTTHTRKKETKTIYPAKVIILGGILVLENKDLRNLMDLKIFVDGDPDVRFVRRLQRDIKERGRSVESVIKQYLETVRPMHLKFVEKSKKYADLVVSGEGNKQRIVEAIMPQICRLL